jgi:hypothetical protein
MTCGKYEVSIDYHLIAYSGEPPTQKGKDF